MHRAFFFLLLCPLTIASAEEPKAALSVPAAAPKPVAKIPDPKWVPAPGDRAVLYMPPGFGDLVPTSADLDAAVEVMKIIRAADVQGFQRIMKRRGGLMPTGTGVLVLEVRNPRLVLQNRLIEARLLDGPNKGKKVFVAARFVARLIDPGSAGTTVVLESPGTSKHFYIAKDIPSFQEMVPLLDAENVQLLRNMVEKKDIFSLPDGTRALVEKVRPGAYYVRLLDGKMKGETGWVRDTSVKLGK